jgi:hypothetical protein
MKQVNKAPVTINPVIASMVSPVNPVITVGRFDLFAVTEISEEVNTPYSLVSQFGKNGIELDNIKAKMQDVLYAEGYRSCNFERDNKEEIAVKFHNQIKSMFIAQMPTEAQELLAKPTKGLNDMQKAIRSNLTNRVSTLFGNLHKAIKSMEDPKEVTAETTVSGKSVPVTGNQLVCRTIMEQIVKLQAIKTPCDKNVEIIKGLQATVKMFNDCGIMASIKK